MESQINCASLVTEEVKACNEKRWKKKKTWGTWVGGWNVARAQKLKWKLLWQQRRSHEKNLFPDKSWEDLGVDPPFNCSIVLTTAATQNVNIYIDYMKNERSSEEHNKVHWGISAKCENRIKWHAIVFFLFCTKSWPCFNGQISINYHIYRVDSSLGHFVQTKCLRVPGNLSKHLI